MSEELIDYKLIDTYIGVEHVIYEGKQVSPMIAAGLFQNDSGFVIIPNYNAITRIGNIGNKLVKRLPAKMAIPFKEIETYTTRKVTKNEYVVFNMKYGSVYTLSVHDSNAIAKIIDQNT